MNLYALSKTPNFFALIILAAILAACSSSPVKQKHSSPYAELYEGKSDLIHATQFPVTSAEEAILRGDAAVGNGDLDRALFEYIRALDFDEHNADALYKIGAIHQSRENKRLAALAYRWSLANQADHAGALEGLGILFLESRRYDEAERHLSKAVEKQPKLWRAHNALGIIADLNKNFQAAQAHYERALDLVPRSSMLLNNLGYSQYLSGDWEAAKRSLATALMINPEYHLAWRNLGLIHTRKGEYAQAVEAFRKTEELAKAYNDVGYLSMMSGRLGQAEAFFDEAMRASPSFYVTANDNAQRVRILKDYGKGSTGL